MKVISDAAALERCLDKHGIADYFENPDLPFRLVEFERGELLYYACDPRENLQFVIDGAISIYAVHEDGSRYYVGKSDCAEAGVMILGDVEFCCEGHYGFFVEAERRVTAVILPLRLCREKLNRDCVFLRSILHTVATKLSLVMKLEALSPTLEEKLLRYLREECEDGCMRGVGSVADHLHCSRRQLQRLLARLCAEGKLEKRARGCYALVAGCRSPE